jgi:septal ring factor EnvC (AmiA/AmiB activator)
VRELVALRIDLEDAGRLEAKIQEEKERLAYYSQELREKEAILNLNRSIQADLSRNRGPERLAQLEGYRKMKSAQTQVERMIQDFNARMELQDAVETERKEARRQRWQREENARIARSAFFGSRGALPAPAAGEIVASFGRAIDPRTQLAVFRKGIEIAAGSQAPVRAVFDGKVVHVGEVAALGRVAIVDHGDHFYTLYGKLGSHAASVGEKVARGAQLGTSDPAGAPVYFEIRSRNIAVDPLEWVAVGGGARTVASRER